MMHAEAQAISAGYQYSMILKQNGSVWAAGNNQRGQLGGGCCVGSASEYKHVPKQDDFVMVVASGECTL